MNDPVALVREKLVKAEAKVLRAEKAVESARTELADLQTTLRVMEGLLGESAGSAANPATPSGVPARQSMILSLLGIGPEKAQPPAELFDDYKAFANEEITLETFRTTIWRMADKVFDTPKGKMAVKRSDDGYWKELVRVINVPNPQAPPIPPLPPAPAPAATSDWGYQPEDDDPFGIGVQPSPRVSFADDLDDDVAF